MDMGMIPSHPGAFLRMEIVEPSSLNVSRVADILDVRRATVSDLLNEKAALSPEMALRWEKAFGVNMEMMLRMQAAYDAAQMRRNAAAIKVKRYEPA